MSKALVIKNADFSTNALEQITIEENIPCTALSLSISAQSVEYVGDTLTITVTKTPADATDIITFTSSEPRVATVDSNGIVSVIGIGEATITGTCGSATATVTINQQGSIKLGNLYNVGGYYPNKVDSENNAANLVSSSSLRALGAVYNGNQNMMIRQGPSHGVQIMRIPYGANYVLIHKASESYAIGTGRQVFYDIEHLTEYNGQSYATYLSDGASLSLAYKRELANKNATGLMFRHDGGTETGLADYITFSTT